MKAANYQYLEFISSFNDHSKGNENLTKVTSSVVENERSYQGVNFFAEHDLRILETISHGENMTFGMQAKDICKYLGDISSSTMSRIFNSSALIESSNEFRELINMFQQPMAKKSLLLDLQSETLCLYQHWHRHFLR